MGFLERITEYLPVEQLTAYRERVTALQSVIQMFARWRKLLSLALSQALVRKVVERQ